MSAPPLPLVHPPLSLTEIWARTPEHDSMESLLTAFLVGVLEQHKLGMLAPIASSLIDEMLAQRVEVEAGGIEIVRVE